MILFRFQKFLHDPLCIVQIVDERITGKSTVENVAIAGDGGLRGQLVRVKDRWGRPGQTTQEKSPAAELTPP